MKGSDESDAVAGDIVHLTRLALSGRRQDVQLLVRRMARRYRKAKPELAESLNTLLRELPTRSSPLRKEAVAAIPVDGDSRLQLIRCETVRELDVEPIFAEGVRIQLAQLVAERRNEDRLNRAGLTPTGSVLFTGAPGVGKTLGARWLAREVGVPLLTLDLSAVMSSFLGRTGNNVRHVLDYAKSVECVLLLDEFDAIAKRRDDATEVGELKRLVTVLLQEIDDWPAGGLLVAATNHADLLDPAVWRRFDMRVEFPMPDEAAIRAAVALFLGSFVDDAQAWVEILPFAFRGVSFSDIERDIVQARRAATLDENGSGDHLVNVFQRRMDGLSREARAEIAVELVRCQAASQRFAHEITGVSRDTIRKAIRGGSNRRSSVQERR